MVAAIFNIFEIKNKNTRVQSAVSHPVNDTVALIRLDWNTPLIFQPTASRTWARRRLSRPAPATTRSMWGRTRPDWTRTRLAGLGVRSSPWGPRWATSGSASTPPPPSWSAASGARAGTPRARARSTPRPTGSSTGGRGWRGSRSTETVSGEM